MSMNSVTRPALSLDEDGASASAAPFTIQVGYDGQRGAYATRAFRPGEKIWRLQGVISPVRTRTSIQIGPAAHIEDDYGQYLNHTCQPNALVKDGALYALTPIEVGDEVTFDYRENESDIAIPFLCRCCDRVIGGRDAPSSLFNGTEWDPAAVLKRQLEAQGFVYLPEFVSEPLHQLLLREQCRLDPSAQDKDFVMGESNTPRRFRALGGRTIAQESPLITGLSDAVRHLIEGLTGVTLYRAAHDQEFAVINHMTPGGQHGWHMDDTSYVVVMVLRAPDSPADGGVCEMVPHCVAVGGPAIAAFVATAVAEDRVSKLFLRSRDAYLIRGDRTLHRVSPLTGGIRTVLAFSYDDQPAKIYGDSADHLYG